MTEETSLPLYATRFDWFESVLFVILKDRKQNCNLLRILLDRLSKDGCFVDIEGRRTSLDWRNYYNVAFESENFLLCAELFEYFIKTQDCKWHWSFMYQINEFLSSEQGSLEMVPVIQNLPTLQKAITYCTNFRAATRLANRYNQLVQKEEEDNNGFEPLLPLKLNSYLRYCLWMQFVDTAMTLQPIFAEKCPYLLLSVLNNTWSLFKTIRHGRKIAFLEKMRLKFRETVKRKRIT